MRILASTATDAWLMSQQGFNYLKASRDYNPFKTAIAGTTCRDEIVSLYMLTPLLAIVFSHEFSVLSVVHPSNNVHWCLQDAQ